MCPILVEELYLFILYALRWEIALRNLFLYLGIAISGFTDFTGLVAAFILPPVARWPREEAESASTWNKEPVLNFSSM